MAYKTTYIQLKHIHDHMDHENLKNFGSVSALEEEGFTTSKNDGVITSWSGSLIEIL